MAIQPLIDEQDDAATVAKTFQPIFERVLDEAHVAHVPFAKVKAALANERDHNCHRRLPCLVKLANEVDASHVLSISVNLYGRKISIYWWDYTSYGKLLNGRRDALTFRKHGRSRAKQLKWALTQFVQRIRGQLPTAPAVTASEASSLLANLGGGPSETPHGTTGASPGQTPKTPPSGFSSGSTATSKPDHTAPASSQTKKLADRSTSHPAETTPALPTMPAERPAQAESKGSSGWMCPVCYIVAGVGAVGIAGGLIFHAKTSSDISKIESGLTGVTAPPTGATRQTLLDEIDSSRSHAHLANAFLVGGSVVLAAGVGLFVGHLLSSGHHHSDAVSLSVGATPRFVSATLSF